MRKAKTIADYAILRWMDINNFEIDKFRLEMHGNSGIITDCYGDSMEVSYNPKTKEITVEK